MCGLPRMSAGFSTMFSIRFSVALPRVVAFSLLSNTQQTTAPTRNFTPYSLVPCKLQGGRGEIAARGADVWGVHVVLKGCFERKALASSWGDSEFTHACSVALGTAPQASADGGSVYRCIL